MCSFLLPAALTAATPWMGTPTIDITATPPPLEPISGGYSRPAFVNKLELEQERRSPGRFFHSCGWSHMVAAARSPRLPRDPFLQLCDAYREAHYIEVWEMVPATRSAPLRREVWGKFVHDNTGILRVVDYREEPDLRAVFAMLTRVMPALWPNRDAIYEGEYASLAEALADFRFNPDIVISLVGPARLRIQVELPDEVHRYGYVLVQSASEWVLYDLPGNTVVELESFRDSLSNRPQEPAPSAIWPN